MTSETSCCCLIYACQFSLCYNIIHVQVHVYKNKYITLACTNSVWLFKQWASIPPSLPTDDTECCRWHYPVDQGTVSRCTVGGQRRYLTEEPHWLPSPRYGTTMASGLTSNTTSSTQRCNLATGVLLLKDPGFDVKKVGIELLPTQNAFVVGSKAPKFTNSLEWSSDSVCTYKCGTYACVDSLCVFYCSHVSQLYCQLQGHVMSCDPPPMELEGRENCVISVCMTARHLLHTVSSPLISPQSQCLSIENV